jgi:hypothetical protein
MAISHRSDPQTKVPLEIEFEHGAPVTNDAVVFIADPQPGLADRLHWCPQVNFFESEQLAQAWAAAHAVTGNVFSLADATALAVRNWRDLAEAEPRA